ncbi:MAG TPA: tetratricopeptide repeat protein [Thermoanaerobaculia bacterium]|nr:tetratricopeptide repeat protein [Thermoanaerobaculia bacterium]
MEPRVLILALPSLVVLALLVWHSWRSLPRRRAIAFWVSVAVYGLLRGVAVAWVTREGLGASLPYQIRDPLLSVFGVSLQEIAGWAIVAYLAWWLGERFARQEKKGPRLFLQVAWGCLFLGAISWAVEAAAIAAGWWHWTVPAGSEVLLRVPWIGLVDWFFVGTDFLLPFLVLTAPALAGRPVRFLALLLFPVHMASHLWVGNLSEGVPIPGFHLVHWLLLGLVIWLALRSPAEDAAFSGPDGIPAAGLGIVLLDVALVELFLVDRPVLLASVVPAAAVALQALRPGFGSGVAAGAVVGSLAFPPLILSALPAFSVLVLRFGRRNRWAAPALMAALASLALVMHGRVGKAEEDLKRRLDEALLARDRGDLTAATKELSDLSRDHPDSHVPRALLGEIQYRTGRLDEARASYEEAVEIKQDFVEGYRYLAVIHLQKGRRDAAAESAARGLAVAPGDLELRYLQGREIGELWPEIEAQGPAAAKALAGLAYEVGDVSGAVEVLDRGIARWPEDRELRSLRGRMAP